MREANGSSADPARVRELFDLLVDLDPAERGRRIAEMCGDDPVLRTEVEALLAMDERAPELLEDVERLVRRSAGSLTRPYEPGARIGEYTVLGELGEGGMGTVYLVRDSKHDRPLALKTLHTLPGAGLGPGRFRREILLTAKLQHPHILPVLDSGEVGGRPWFTMPYVEGETLRARLRREGRLPVDEAVRVMREIALALGHAHRNGVVHRDIKPENVLLSGGVAVVADFGVAKALAAARGEGGGEGGQAGRGADAPLGTPAYMAPEQVLGDPAADHRVDLYALGCVAYELLTGAPPFAGDSSRALIQAHLEEAPEPIAQRRPDVPPALASLIMRCLSKDPAGRPGSAAEVLHVLASLGTGPGVGAGAGGGAADGAGEIPSGAAGARRPRRWLRAGVVVAAAVALLAVGLLRVIPPEQRAILKTLITRDAAVLNPRRVVVAPLENRTGDAAFDALGEMAADWIAQDLMRAGEFEVVDPRTSVMTAAIMARVPRPLRAADLAVALAEEVGAGLLVSGSMYLAADSLRFQVRLTDVATGRIVRAMPPMNADRANPSAGVAALGRRTAAALFAVVDTAAGAVAGGAGNPPSYEAYHETSRAWESFFRGDWDDFFARLWRASALDSTYATPVLLEMWGWETQERWDRVVPLLDRVKPLESSLTPQERWLLEVIRAGVRGDYEARLDAAETLLRLQPGSSEVPLLVAHTANWLGRPAIALAALDGTDPTRGLNLLSPWYWAYRAWAQHQAGDYTGELESARRGVRQFPGAPIVVRAAVRALAALGRTTAVERIAAESGDVLDVREEALAFLAARELRAHGDSAAASRVLALAMARLGPTPKITPRAAPSGTEKGGVIDPDRFALHVRGALLYEAGRWAAAREAILPLARDTTDVRALGMLGAIAARLGDEAELARVSERLVAMENQPLTHGEPALWLAHIAAIRGDTTTALDRIREALEKGQPVMGESVLHADLHAELDFHPLRELAAFRALISR